MDHYFKNVFGTLCQQIFNAVHVHQEMGLLALSRRFIEIYYLRQCEERRVKHHINFGINVHYLL